MSESNEYKELDMKQVIKILNSKFDKHVIEIPTKANPNIDTARIDISTLRHTVEYNPSFVRELAGECKLPPEEVMAIILNHEIDHAYELPRNMYIKDSIVRQLTDIVKGTEANGDDLENLISDIIINTKSARENEVSAKLWEFFYNSKFESDPANFLGSYFTYIRSGTISPNAPKEDILKLEQLVNSQRQSRKIIPSPQREYLEEFAGLILKYIIPTGTNSLLVIKGGGGGTHNWDKEDWELEDDEEHKKKILEANKNLFNEFDGDIREYLRLNGVEPIEVKGLFREYDLKINSGLRRWDGRAKNLSSTARKMPPKMLKPGDRIGIDYTTIKVEAPQKTVSPNVLLVIDSSRSMSGGKFKATELSALAIIEGLLEQRDYEGRIGVINFSTEFYDAESDGISIRTMRSELDKITGKISLFQDEGTYLPNHKVKEYIEKWGDNNLLIVYLTDMRINEGDKATLNQIGRDNKVVLLHFSERREDGLNENIEYHIIPNPRDIPHSIGDIVGRNMYKIMGGVQSE